MSEKNAATDGQTANKEAEGGEKKAADNYLNLKVKSQVLIISNQLFLKMAGYFNRMVKKSFLKSRNPPNSKN